MNKYGLLCGFITALCVGVICAACAVGNGAWYVWILSLALIGWLTYSEWPKNKYNFHERHILCARVSNLNACVLSWVVLWLNLWPHPLVGIAAILWASTAFWICCVHLADKEGKFFWWLGLTVTAVGMIGCAATIFADNLGHKLPVLVSGGIVVFSSGIFFLTLIIGFILYVYPQIKEIVADIIEIRQIIKGKTRHND